MANSVGQTVRKCPNLQVTTEPHINDEAANLLDDQNDEDRYDRQEEYRQELVVESEHNQNEVDEFPHEQNRLLESTHERETEQNPGPDENGEYLIDKITKKRKLIKRGVTAVQYFVKWKGYSRGTWEPEKNVVNTFALLKFNKIARSVGSRESSTVFGKPLNRFESVLFAILEKFYIEKKFSKDFGFYSKDSFLTKSYEIEFFKQTFNKWKEMDSNYVLFPHIIGSALNGKKQKLEFERQYSDCKGVYMLSPDLVKREILKILKVKPNIICLCFFPNGIKYSPEGSQYHSNLLIFERSLNRNKLTYYDPYFVMKTLPRIINKIKNLFNRKEDINLVNGGNPIGHNCLLLTFQFIAYILENNCIR